MIANLVHIIDHTKIIISKTKHTLFYQNQNIVLNAIGKCVVYV